MRWYVSQLGAREHYAVPRGFHREGALERFYTEAWCAPWAQPWVRRISKTFASRAHPALGSEWVENFNGRAVPRRLYEAWVRRARPEMDPSYLYLSAGRWFAETVAKDLSKRPLEAGKHAFFGFNTGSLETLWLARERGVCRIVDQIDPGLTEIRIVEEECSRWSGWQSMPTRSAPAYWSRIAAEWEAATFVLVNSTWSQRALVEQGVPEEKIMVVPLAYEVDASRERARIVANRRQPLRVLWLGSVNLRKGIQYLIGAAKRLADENIQFTVVGGSQLHPEVLADTPKNMTFVGHVDRAGAAAYYRAADVFVLPTLSDGFAITQLEAMSHGLPVVTTPNCGEVVTHGVDGLIVPIRDSNALATAILQLESDRESLRSMSEAAVQKSAEFSVERYARSVQAHVARYYQA